MLTLTCCQDHILTENIWFVWSKTSYSGDERRCYQCGTNDQTNIEDRATQPMEVGGWVSQSGELVELDRIGRIGWIGIGKLGLWAIWHLTETFLGPRPILFPSRGLLILAIFTMELLACPLKWALSFFYDQVCMFRLKHFLKWSM